MHFERRGWGKKGASEDSSPLGFATTAVIVALFAIVIIVGIILFYTKGTGVIDKVPAKDLEVMVQSCTIAANSGLRQSYCENFNAVDISGRTLYVNCQFEQIRKIVEEDLSKSGSQPPACASESANILSWCKNLALAFKLKDNTVVNGLSCNLNCNDIALAARYNGGVLKSSCDVAAGEKDYSASVTAPTEKAQIATKTVKCCATNSVKVENNVNTNTQVVSEIASCDSLKGSIVYDSQTCPSNRENLDSKVTDPAEKETIASSDGNIHCCKIA